MNKISIVFMGTPDFAVTTLAALVAADYSIVGVITAPDRPAGRGRKLHSSAVKKYALEQNLTVWQPTNLKGESFINTLRGLEATLQIVVAFRMLPKVVWEMPRYGTFNLHASLLPDYRGAAPINWALINGETKTGVTTFFIDDKIDTGEIISQKETFITENDTAGSLHDRLMHLGADLVLETVALISKGTVQTQKQPQRATLKKAFKIFTETCKVSWDAPIKRIYNHIRGLSPYPVAWSQFVNGEEKMTVKIYSVEKETATHDLSTGSIVAGKKEMKVAVKGGYIRLLEIQLQGRRRMKVADLLNGLEIKKNSYMA